MERCGLEKSNNPLISAPTKQSVTRKDKEFNFQIQTCWVSLQSCRHSALCLSTLHCTPFLSFSPAVSYYYIIVIVNIFFSYIATTFLFRSFTKSFMNESLIIVCSFLLEGDFHLRPQYSRSVHVFIFCFCLSFTSLILKGGFHFLSSCLSFATSLPSSQLLFLLKSDWTHPNLSATCLIRNYSTWRVSRSGMGDIKTISVCFVWVILGPNPSESNRCSPLVYTLEPNMHVLYKDSGTSIGGIY